MISKILENVELLLQGEIPEPIKLEAITDENESILASLLNQFAGSLSEVHKFVIPLSKGELANISMSSKNFLGSPFKELHSRLMHLTWQTQQVAKGDFNQRVDFMGEFSEAFNSMIIALDNKEKALKQKIDELEKALARIHTLEGVLPICSNCKKIRKEDENPENQDSWVQVESYITDETDAQFSHSVCPECIKKLYPDLD